MIKFECTPYIRCADPDACMRIQELLNGARKQLPFSKVVFGPDKMTLYKWRLPMGEFNYEQNGLKVDMGMLTYTGF